MVSLFLRPSSHWNHIDPILILTPLNAAIHPSPLRPDPSAPSLAIRIFVFFAFLPYFFELWLCYLSLHFLQLLPVLPSFHVPTVHHPTRPPCLGRRRLVVLDVVFVLLKLVLTLPPQYLYHLFILSPFSLWTLPPHFLPLLDLLLCRFLTLHP
ncbi:hypothetical protein EDB19DRAFT_2046857 [Suillus lakei]|nr:hypothetical protein EDB19DRAFT_2046857 [Suillus lakei]